MKKILIISYYWPPNSGSGVQRWLKFSKYLLNYDCKPIVVTPENPYIELKDSELVKEVSNKIEVIKLPIWEPYSIKDKIFGKKKKSQTSGLISKDSSLKIQALNWLRGNFFIPDPKRFWIKPTFNSLKKIIKEKEISYVISTGPPHSMHLIALELKKIYGHIKWIADFRDPWTKLDILEDFNLNNRSKRIHKKLESEVLKYADLVLTVSETWASDFVKLGARNVEVITNGYDHQDFLDFKSTYTNKFIIGHYGIMNHLRNPSNLWSVLNDLCKENTEFDERLEIRLSGNIDSNIIKEINSYSSLKSKLVLLGYLSHKDVLLEYSKANLLLLLLFNSISGEGNYPGKVFEYIATKKSIIAFGPEKSDIKNLFKKGYGLYHSYNDELINIKKNILAVFRNENNIKQVEDGEYSRKNLTKKLVNLLEKL